MSVGTISRKELKGIVNGAENSSNFESTSFGIGTSRQVDSSSYIIAGTSKMISNIDSIYGFYKKKGNEDDNEDEITNNINELSRNTTNFENSTNQGNYVPAN